MAPKPSRDERDPEALAVIRALIMGATRETALWLQSASIEEQVHLFGLQALLDDLARIVERRIEGRALAEDDREYAGKVDKVKSKLKKAIEVQGRIVGETLRSLEARLPSVLLAHSKPKARSTGIIPGQSEGIPQLRLTELMQRRLEAGGRAKVNEKQTPESPDPILEAFGINDTTVASEQNSAQNSGKTTQGAHKSAGKAIQIAGGKSWDEIEITFVSEKTVQIYVAGINRGPFNYSELGFEDRKTTNPILAWKMLDQIAGENGAWPRPRPGTPKVQQQKRIEEIRKRMRGIFLIKTDPIPFNGSMYQTSFKICRGASYDA